MVTENGYINLSIDALGTNSTSGGYIQVNKPSNATVRGAYLIAASTGMSGRKLLNGDITIDGVSVTWDTSISSSISSWNHWAEITSIIKAKIDASPAGLIDFLITENNTTGIDGSILAVIFDDPNQIDRNTVVLFFGAQKVAGDDFYVRFAQPINLSDPRLRLDFSLGIGYGYQAGGTQQYSIIDVNGKRLTTSAGGEDDGISSNGGLITVGGIGDVNTNPVNPTATPTTCRDDDELYNLIPFVTQGDTITHIFTKNPSNDDNLFFAALFSSVTSIVGEGILLSPNIDTNFIGTKDTLIAKVQNTLGAPIVGRNVVFEIIAGPHSGIKDSSITNSMGNAIFTFTGVTIGQDEIIAKMIASSGDAMSSNSAYHFWKTPNTNTPPTTEPVFIPNPASETPTIGWNYADLDGNPQTQYEVEVWTGPNGTGSNLWNPAVGSGVTTSVTFAGSALINGQRYYARVRAHDGISWGSWSEESWIAELTIPPIASAGPDQTKFTGVSECVVLTQLDGSGSSDPRGESITYTWTGPFSGFLTSATPSVNLPLGVNQIILRVTNTSGLSDTDTVMVDIRDTLPPVPNQSNLPDITSQCSVTLTPPTATDNCGSIINGTTSTTTFNTQGIFDIEWVYQDPSGNTSRQAQRIIIEDNTPPVPQRSTLPAITGNCSVGNITAPTAFDSCSARIITATTTDPLVYNQPGNYTITWRYADTMGNTTTQPQSVVISDLTPPVPVLANLPVMSSTSSLTVTTIPTAFDSCTRKIINGSTTDPLTYNNPGIDTITWTYTDSSGNTSSQQQQVSIIDNIAPVPDSLILDTIRGECTATVTDTPTATDNFCGIIHGATSDPLTYSTQGVHTITWNYTDNSGNTSTQTQLVIIDDVTPPVPLNASLTDIQNECSVSITDYPQASDNCGTTITATTTSPLTYNNQGRYTITWTYDDGNGNTATQEQTVIIKDSITPVISTLSDRVLTIKSTAFGANIPIETAHATDNCTPVSVQGVRSDSLRLDTLYFEGATRITWTACDTNKNCSSASQTITVIRNHAPVLQIPADTSLSEGEILSFVISASDSDGAIPSIFIDSLTFPFVFKDSANGQSTLSLRPGCTDHGIYTIKVHASDSIDTITREFAVTIKDINYPPEFDTTSSFVAHEMVEFKTTIKVYDCDNPNPKIRIINAPKGAQFTDNNNGTGTFIWTPGGSDNGFYMVIFEAQDDMTTVRDTIIIEVTDVNAYPPELTVSVSDTTIPLNLPVVVYATAKDRDGTPTYIRASGLPSGALFESDDNGTALVRWTPADTGIFTFSFIAIDAADTTVKVSKEVQLKVSNINLTGPEFSAVQNFIIDQNKQFTTILEAHDPDGTIPVLRLKSGQQRDLTFTDNGNGTATLSWMPACNVSGTFYLTATASDQSFTDSVTFAITVRDVNCPPVLFRISDINAQAGEMVRILVRAYDPDGDTVIPTLSVGCTLPGHTFTSSGNGTGTFRWQAIYNTGSYPVTFYASDGIAADSFTMHININKTGNIKILSTTSGSSIYVMPAGPYKGEFLGTDSVTMSIAPGIYHFEVHKKGYRSEQFSVKVFADSSVEKVCSLKVSIPLMTSLLDTSFISQDLSPSHFPSSFTDVNYDGYIDYTVLSDSGIKVFPGLDSSGLKYDSKSYTLADSIPASAVHYEFVDWNDDKTLDCIYSDLAGNIIVANFRIGTFETVVSLPGSKIFFSVLDINNDHYKDLIVHSEGTGFSVYLNQSDDKSPSFTVSHQIAITSGQLPANLHGAFTFIDIDGNGTSELLIKNENSPALFKIDSSFTEMSYIDDLNCAGKRIASDTLTICQFGSPCNLPRIILKTAAHSLLFRTHLLGDVNNDNKVDIRDISKISRLWEITDTDESWDPECNLRLSRSGQEKIDIRDISSASKSWELQQ